MTSAGPEPGWYFDPDGGQNERYWNGISDDGEAERLFAALPDGGTAQVPMAPTPFASRLGLLADKFGVPWMVVSQNATG